MNSADSDIIMVGWAAVKGTVVLASSYNGCRLKKAAVTRISGFMRQELDGLEQNLSLVRSAVSEGSDIIYRASRGGVFRALWDMAEELGAGITVDLGSISIKQETIELCEEFDVNPYMLDSTGALLVVSGTGNALVRKLNNSGLHAVIVGYVTDTNDRIIINGDETRYIEARIRDELERIQINE